MCAGADFVMVGGMFAGTNECEGEWEYEYKSQFKTNDGKIVSEWWQPFNPGGNDRERRKTHLKFYGMSSHYAQEKHGEGKKNYRASEGKVSLIKYKGPVEYTIQEILGGLRSCGAYIGAKYLKDFSKCAKFARVNRK